MPGAGSVVGVAKASWLGPRAITSTPRGTSCPQAGRGINSPLTITIVNHLGKRACMIVISRNEKSGTATAVVSLESSVASSHAERHSPADQGYNRLAEG